MSQLTPDQVKPHLSIMPEYVDEDALIQSIIDASEAYVVQYTRRDLDADFPGGWPADILQAVKLLVAHFYENREATMEAGDRALPFGVRPLLAAHRDFIK